MNTVYAKGKAAQAMPSFYQIAAVSNTTLGAISKNDGSDADFLLFYRDPNGSTVLVATEAKVVSIVDILEYRPSKTIGT